MTPFRDRLPKPVRLDPMHNPLGLYPLRCLHAHILKAEPAPRGAVYSVFHPYRSRTYVHLGTAPHLMSVSLRRTPRVPRSPS